MKKIMKHKLFIVAAVIMTVFVLITFPYKKIDDTLHEAAEDPKGAVQKLLSDDSETDAERAEKEEKAQIPHPEEGNHAQIGGTLTTTEDHPYPDMQYTLHSIKVFDSFEETGLDSTETEDPSSIETYSQDCKLIMADFTVKYVGDTPISPDLVREKMIFLDMRLYSGLTSDSGFDYMSEPFYFSAHDDEYKKYWFMPVSQPGDTLDFQVAFYCKKEYVGQTDTTIAILSTSELENSLYFDIFGSGENEAKMESEAETSESESESSATEWTQQGNHYLRGEPVNIFLGDDQQEVECMAIDVTGYEGGYIEAGVQEYVEKNLPEIVECQDQACIEVTFLIRSVDGESVNYENLLENLQIVLLENTDNKILYTTTIMTGKENGDIRPDGYECCYGAFLCPKEVMESPWLCLKFTGNDKNGEVYFDINVTDPDFDPDQYDTRF